MIQDIDFVWSRLYHCSKAGSAVIDIETGEETVYTLIRLLLRSSLIRVCTFAFPQAVFVLTTLSVKIDLFAC